MSASELIRTGSSKRTHRTERGDLFSGKTSGRGAELKVVKWSKTKKNRWPGLFSGWKNITDGNRQMSRQTCWPVVLCCLLIQRCGGWLGRESSEVGHRLNKGCAMEWRSRAEWVPTRTTTELSSPSKVGTFLPVLCLVSFFPVPPWINCADDSCRRVHLDFGSYKYRSRYLLIYSLHCVWARIASCCQPNLEARSLEAFDRKMIYNAFHMPYPKKKSFSL